MAQQHLPPISTSSVEPSFADTRDFTAASRGHIASLSPCIIKTATGRVCWDNDAFSFLHSQPCPPSTANPKLWRQGQLNSKQGLFAVIPDCVYQLRGFDISVMTVIESATGIIIIDPLVSCECAAAALELYRAHRGRERRVVGLIYSHSHADHYMGALGVLPEWSANEPQKPTYDFPIVAPEGFMEAAMSENILAGPAMRQRAAYMYGRNLPRSPEGLIGVGLGQTTSTGTTSLVPPNALVRVTGQEMVIDGVRFVFQMVPDSEAPAEMNFWLPDWEALCVPEIATNCLHNVVTLRGAQVRDAKAWAGYLDEALVMFGAGSQVMFQSHNWPVWGVEEVKERLAIQRDLYAYIHDQTVRMMNLGLTGIEIAENMQLPPGLRREWHTQGFYGSVSHNVKGVYQKYMTWFDGKAENLWKLPPTEEGKRYVDCMGGVDAVCTKADQYADQGDLRFAATLLSHARAADPDNERVKTSLALVFQRLGFGAENATWRNFYLTAAQDVRTGQKIIKSLGTSIPLAPSMSVEQWFDVLSVQLNGEMSGENRFVIDVRVTDLGRKWRLIVSNGVLTHREIREKENRQSNELVEGKPALDLAMRKVELLEALRGKQVDCERKEGKLGVLRELLILAGIVKSSTRGQSQL